MHGRFGWNELATDNIEAAKTYYARTLGWTYERFPMEEGEYWIAKTADGSAAAGLMAIPPDDPDSQPGWLSYVTVDNIDQRCSAVTAAGGQVLLEPTDLPGVGKIAVVQDPSGGVLGYLTPHQASA